MQSIKWKSSYRYDDFCNIRYFNWIHQSVPSFFFMFAMVSISRYLAPCLCMWIESISWYFLCVTFQYNPPAGTFHGVVCFGHRPGPGPLPMAGFVFQKLYFWQTKILYIIDGLGAGGAERQLAVLIKGLNESKNIKPYVCVWNYVILQKHTSMHVCASVRKQFEYKRKLLIQGY